MTLFLLARLATSVVGEIPRMLLKTAGEGYI